MTYKPIPTKTEGARTVALVEDDDVFQVLKAMLDELKLINIQLRNITQEDADLSDSRSL